MPLSRYQIRNEYSLADPELYRAADKDDPEALLEGVAMAGLVGVLRQLGDLAEFAAEIFHDLHEEVMVTAARGHSLMVRVQQLEAEFPTIEKAFLSQSSHSSFFYNPGSDWHPNMHMHESLIAQGDLPRFVMDSYEECRGPPRLFLLDKFDVAGAGACLKRYSDPSFFKVEPPSFGITGTDVQREKKARKAKKKGSRWRNGETPEALPASHTKLHQLFLEERIQNGISDPARRVKLKRRLNGFPFDSKSGKSYMEKFLKSPSPDHKEVYEVPVDSSPYESALDMCKISKMSPEKESDTRSISPSSSPAKEGIIPELSVDKLNEVPSGTRDSVVLQSDPDLETYNNSDSGLQAYNIPSTLEMEDSEKEIAVDGGSKTDDSVEDYQSDDIASEVDNYMDALTTMESEMDTDSEFKLKNDLCYLNSRREGRDLDANDLQLQAHSSDSQSMGNYALSDDGNSSSKKEISSFSYSDTHSTAAENTPSDGEVSCNVFPSTEIHEAEIVDSSLNLQPINQEHPGSQPPGSAVLDSVSSEVAKIPSHSSELVYRTASLTPSDSNPSYRSTEAFMKESALMVPKTDEIITNPCSNILHNSSISDTPKQKEDDFPQRLSGENQLMDESEGGDKNTSEIVPDTSGLSVPSHSIDDFRIHVLAENQLVDELNDEDLNPDENVAFVSEQDLNYDGPAETNDENSSLLSTEDQPLIELHAEDQNLNAPFTSNLSDSPSHLRDGLSVAASAESLPVKEIVKEYPNSIPDGLVCVSNIMETAEKKSDESSLDNVAEIETNKEIYIPNSDDNQIGQQNPVMSLADEQPLGQTHYLDAEPGDTVSKIDDVSQSAGEITDNVITKEDTPSELVESLVSETNIDVLSIRYSEEQTSCSRRVYIDEHLDTGESAEMSEAACNTTLLERDSTAEHSLLAGNHVLLDEIDTQPVNAPAAFTGPDNNATEDSDGSSGDLKTLREVSLSGSEGELKGLITEEACSSERPEESSSLQGSDSVFGQVVDNDQSESEPQIVNYVSGTYLVLEANGNLDATAAVIQSSSKQNDIESSQTEENAGSLTDQLDQILPSVLGANSELLTDLRQTPYEKHIDHVGPFGTSSESLPVNLPNEPSETGFSLQGSNKINISEHPIYPSSSISSSVSPLPNASQIYVEEMPPMPPLPPVQWRMTKFQHASPGQQSVSVLNSASVFPPLLPSKADQDTQPVNQLWPQSALGDENSHLVSEQPSSKAVHLSPFSSQVPSVVHHGDSKDDILAPEGPSHLSGSDGEILQNSFWDEERENEKSSFSNLSLADTASTCALGLSHEESTKPLNQVAPETSLNDKELVQSSTIPEENVVISNTTTPSKTDYEQPQQATPASAHAFGLSNEKLIGPLNQVAPETSSKEELGNSSGHLEEDLGSYDNNLASATTENEQPQHAMSTSEATLAWPVGEENKPNGHRPMKLPRPRNPLIDAVAALDKSKLRKVTERVRPQIQKEDERDSLLEQIRTKSFNLKPAAVTRPSIPGPTTNLKVAAILEKAKTIRQAFAGSDEDDDGSWSDS